MKERKLTKIRIAIKKTIPLLAMALFLAGLFSCSDDSGRSSGQPGKLTLSLNTDTTFRQNISTKAVSDEFQDFLDPDQYTVSILQEENHIKDYPTYLEMPDEIALEAGTYTLKAHKGENVAGGFLSPYFEGSMNFIIESEMRTPIEVVCQLANTRVTVDFEEDFLEAYPSYAVHFLTSYLTDTLTVAKDEERAAYFRSDSGGTDLEIILELQRLEDDNTYYYKPSAIPIEPRQNVHLVFRTDGEAINGIGLTVTLNNDLDGSVDLEMKIPEYAYGEVERPTLGKERFALEVADVTYRTLQKNDDYYYLDYIVPGSVGKAVLKTDRIENGHTTSEEYDLATDADIEAARLLGITITDLENKTTYTSTKDTRRGRIHFSEALAKLAPSKNMVEYAYTMYFEDALPVNPNRSDTATFIVRPNAVGVSKLTGANIQDQTVMAGKKLLQNMEVAFNTDAGIKTAVLEVYRNDNLAHTYSILSDELPEGIVFENDKLTFDKSFTQHLEAGSFGMNEKYTYRIQATDLVNEVFEDSPANFSVIVTPFVEIIIPVPEIWGWKAKAIVEVDGLTEGNKTDIALALSEDNVNFTEQTNYTIIDGKAHLLIESLVPDKTYYIKASIGGTEITESFMTEGNVQIMYGNMNTWYLNNTKCTFLGIASKYIPFPILNSTGESTYWKTNNHVTAGETFSDLSANNLPKGCFPTVVYENRDETNQFAAVIRSIDATAKNGRARGELAYENNHTSRPSSISFDYVYEAAGDEVFISDVIVYSGDVIIGTGARPASVGAESIYKVCTVPITYTETTLKATAIRIFFASSDKESGFSTTSGQKISVPKASATTSAAVYPGSYETLSNVNAGSTLKIDNVTLNYAE